ncbi:transposase [Senegalimassilia anaerobia]|uniref:transposase n=1 Tax=Senegalimassilia anaerobia TaxID=1473216 RepID=UPI003CD0D2E4
MPVVRLVARVPAPHQGPRCLWRAARDPDAHKGLFKMIEEVPRGASYQRCLIHLMRDCMRGAGSC